MQMTIQKCAARLQNFSPVVVARACTTFMAAVMGSVLGRNVAPAILIVITILHQGGIARPLNAQEPATSSSPWDPDGIQDFSLTDRSGETVTKEKLLGHEWVAGFIFTRCKGPCPTVVGQMKILQEQTGVTLVIFSVQPEVDTPEVLKNFATAYVPQSKPDATGKTPPWYWLTGDRREIYELIGKSFKMPVAKVDAAEGYNVIHSNNLMHVDERGRVLGKYNAMEPAEVALLRRILQGKSPRGKMISGTVPASDGQPVEVEGAQAAGLKISRQIESTEEANDNPAVEEKSTLTDSENGALPSDIPQWVLTLPTVNASLNGLATILLISGYVLIKRKHAHAHKVVMLSSFATSVIFLGSYLTYHYFAGSKKFPGTGMIRSVYLLILVSHIILAAAVPVLASMTIYRAFRQEWDKHLRIARITFPIWVYVSVTGVIIYFMLYHWPITR